MNDPVQPGAVQHTYGRNALDQLTADARSGSGSGSTSWGYDSAYHTTSRADSAAGSGDTYAVDAAGQLTGLVTKVGTTTTRNLTLTYNADGARTGQSDSVSGASASYGYDQADRLVSFASGATTASYGYDGDGLRAGKTVNGTATAETWDVAEGLPLLLQDGATRYIDGPGGTPIEQVDGAGNAKYYLVDHQGSVRGLVDGTGTVTDSYSYDPYGQRTAVTGSAASTPFGYAGQDTDAETGFQYLRARYYDPATGQFLTVDPLVDSTGHPYAYAGDNPVNASDPGGLSDCFDLSTFMSCTLNNAFNNGVQAGLEKLNSTPWGHDLLVTINNFDNSDLSNAVIGDLQGVLAGSQQALAAAGTCVHNAVACGKLALALALYIKVNWRDVLNSAVAAQLANLDQLRQEIDCGRYGLAAGHLLVGFVTTFGPAKLAELLKVGDLLHIPKGGSPCGLCFPAGTLVTTPAGEKPIEQLHSGDMVLAEDPKTKKVEAEQVSALIAHPVSELARVSLNDGSTVTVTADHPFYVDSSAGRKEAAWVQAGDLRVGDRLRGASGRDVSVRGVRYNVGRAVVYTLTVATDHTFFVGAAQVLVHNSLSTNCNILLPLLKQLLASKAGFTGRGIPLILDAHLESKHLAELIQLLKENGFEARSVTQIFGTSDKLKDPEIRSVAEALGIHVVTKDVGRQAGGGFGKLAIVLPGSLSGNDIQSILRYILRQLGR